MLAIFGVLHLFTIPAVGMGLLLAGALLVAVRYRRRRALQKWLNTQSFEIHASDLGDHLRVACLLRLEPLEAVHLLHWRVALVYAAEISNFPWVIDVAALDETETLNRSLALGDTLELKCVLPVPKEWLEKAFIEGGCTTDDMGWFVRVELTFGSSLVWIGVTQPVDSLEQFHETVQ